MADSILAICLILILILELLILIVEDLDNKLFNFAVDSKSKLNNGNPEGIH